MGKQKAAKAVLNYTSAILNIIVNLIFYGIVIFVISTACKSAYNFSYQIYGDVVSEKSPGREIIFDIKDGASAYTVAKQLELNKIIVNKYSFLIRYELSEKTIWPGKYTLSTSMNYEEILDTICDYDTAKEAANKKETNNAESTKAVDKNDSK